MKAFLLAAGKGMRLRPITNTIPKCLVPIGGIPLLQIWLTLFEKYGITDVFINTHYLSEKIASFIHNVNTKCSIQLGYEKTMLGSGGTIYKNRSFVEATQYFFVIYADTFTTFNLRKMLDSHLEKKSFLTMGLFHTPLPHQSGVVVMDSDNMIIDFQEKPKHPKSDLANAGIMIISSKIFEVLNFRESHIEYPLDLAFNILPKLIGLMHGYIIHEPLIDIGTPENLKKANMLWPDLYQALGD